VLQSAALGERRLDELTQLLADAEKKRFQKNKNTIKKIDVRERRLDEL
jgi:hypothetical protein